MVVNVKYGVGAMIFTGVRIVYRQPCHSEPKQQVPRALPSIRRKMWSIFQSGAPCDATASAGNPTVLHRHPNWRCKGKKPNEEMPSIYSLETNTFFNCIKTPQLLLLFTQLGVQCLAMNSVF